MAKKTPETSKEAYRSLDPDKIREIYQLILFSLSQLGEATFEEIAASLKVSKDRVWKRLSELNKEGLIYRPGNKRMLKSGRSGYTWMLTEKGRPNTTKAEKALKGKSVSDYSKKITELSNQYTQSTLF